MFVWKSSWQNSRGKEHSPVATASAIAYNPSSLLSLDSRFYLTWRGKYVAWGCPTNGNRTGGDGDNAN